MVWCIIPTPTGWFLDPNFFAGCWVQYYEIPYFYSHAGIFEDPYKFLDMSNNLI